MRPGDKMRASPTSSAGRPRRFPHVSIRHPTTPAASWPSPQPEEMRHKVIWVVGDGRSGTTWVSNLINYRRAYRFLFEPFHPDVVPAMQQFKPFTYLRRGDHDEYYGNVAQAVFSGSITHPRVNWFNYGCNSADLLVKDIFGHLLMPWVDKHFPTVRKVLVLRHPCAVAASKERLKNWSWVKDPAHLFAQRTLMEDCLSPYIGSLEWAHNQFEKYVLIWSIVHHVVLKQLAVGRVHIVFYEMLCADPDNEIRRMLAYAGENLDHPLLDPRLAHQYEQPSQTTRPHNSPHRCQDSISRWQQQVSDSKVEAALRILKLFGLHRIYDENPMPNCEAAALMLATPCAPQVRA